MSKRVNVKVNPRQAQWLADMLRDDYRPRSVEDAEIAKSVESAARKTLDYMRRKKIAPTVDGIELDAAAKKSDDAIVKSLEWHATRTGVEYTVTLIYRDGHQATRDVTPDMVPYWRDRMDRESKGLVG